MPVSHALIPAAAIPSQALASYSSWNCSSGLVFQVPLLLFVLGWLGVISSDSLRRWRRFAIVLAFFLGMVLTPPDPMSQFLMAFPLVVLYELCIWGVKLKEVVSSPAARDSGKTEGDDAAK